MIHIVEEQANSKEKAIEEKIAAKKTKKSMKSSKTIKSKSSNTRRAKSFKAKPTKLKINKSKLLISATAYKPSHKSTKSVKAPYISNSYYDRYTSSMYDTQTPNLKHQLRIAKTIGHHDTVYSNTDRQYRPSQYRDVEY